jgi:hypothetical protein
MAHGGLLFHSMRNADAERGGGPSGASGSGFGLFIFLIKMFAVHPRSRRTTKMVDDRLCWPRRQASFFVVRCFLRPLPCVQREGARQRPFAVQKCVVRPLLCVSGENTRQSHCYAFLGLCRALERRGYAKTFIIPKTRVIQPKHSNAVVEGIKEVHQKLFNPGVF